MGSRVRFMTAPTGSVLMRVASEGAAAAYAGYSYRERCDRYVKSLSREEVERIRAVSAYVTYSTLRERIRAEAYSEIELMTGRG